MATKQDRADHRRYTPRSLVYLTAVTTGLRRNELARLIWSDIDFVASTIRVRIGVGKAKREDIIPMHQQLAEALRESKKNNAKLTDRVFKTMPTMPAF